MSEELFGGELDLMISCCDKFNAIHRVGTVRKTYESFFFLYKQVWFIYNDDYIIASTVYSYIHKVEYILVFFLILQYKALVIFVRCLILSMQLSWNGINYFKNYKCVLV